MTKVNSQLGNPFNNTEYIFKKVVYQKRYHQEYDISSKDHGKKERKKTHKVSFSIHDWSVFFFFWLLCCNIRAWLHKTSTRIWILSPGLENNHTLILKFSNFTIYVRSVGKCRTNISTYCCFPIQGTRSQKIWTLLQTARQTARQTEDSSDVQTRLMLQINT